MPLAAQRRLNQATGDRPAGKQFLGRVMSPSFRGSVCNVEDISDINQPLCLKFAQTWTLFQREAAEAQTGAVTHQPQAGQFVGLANSDLHRVATAGAQTRSQKLGRDPVLDSLKQRMAKMILLVAFQTHQFRLKTLSRKGPLPTTGNRDAPGRAASGLSACAPASSQVDGE